MASRETPPDDTDSLVRVDADGQLLSLQWGPPPPPTRGRWAAIATLMMMIAFVGLIVAAAIESGNPTGANIAGFGGVAAFVGALGATAMAMGRGVIKPKGSIIVNGLTVQTHLRRDPYAMVRPAATDEVPQFRASLDRSLIRRVDSRRSRAAGAGNIGKHELMATMSNGLEYVLAVRLPKEIADQLADELRAHLELPATPARESAARRERAERTALAELHEAITDQRKGPVILPEADQRTRLTD